jgi:hypothetical protein
MLAAGAGARNPSMDRRFAMACLAASFLAPSAALASPHRVPATDALLMLDSYLALPPAERDRFSFVYRVMRDDKPAADARATLVTADGARIPFVIEPDGTIANLPTLEQLKHKAMFETDGRELSFLLEPRATIAPSTRIAVGDLVQAMAQLNAAIARFAGAYSGQVDKLTAAFFPDAGEGQAVLADGSSRPLPTFKFKALGKTAYFEQRRAPGAVAVTFAQPPSRIILSPPP